MPLLWGHLLSLEIRGAPTDGDSAGRAMLLGVRDYDVAQSSRALSDTGHEDVLSFLIGGSQETS